MIQVVKEGQSLPVSFGSADQYPSWHDHTFSSPSNPTVTARVPFPSVTTWWLPILWAFSMDWTSGNSVSVVEWILMAGVPETERIWLWVTANEKMSVKCAAIHC